jgi:ABC-type multidrug transport system ATPase subunit
VLRVEGLGKRYESRWIFRGLAFSLGAGDRLVVLGRNGAGKSTLLRTLAGLVQPSEGRVELPPEPRRSLGFSGLEQALYPQLTVDEHLNLAAELRDCDARADELLDQVELAYARELPASKLSTGMKARLKLALAIQPRPQVLLLDEPGASLDEQGRGIVEAVCAEQASRGCLIVATNDPTERRLANLELRLES